MDSFSKWMEQDLQYLCEYCDIVFQIKDLLFNHINSIHKVSRVKYVADNPEYAVKARGVGCKICLRDIRDVASHLKGSHNGLTPEVYFMRFVYQDAEMYSMKDKEIGCNEPSEKDNDQIRTISIEREAKLDTSSFDVERTQVESQAKLEVPSFANTSNNIIPMELESKLDTTFFEVNKSKKPPASNSNDFNTSFNDDTLNEYDPLKFKGEQSTHVEGSLMIQCDQCHGSFPHALLAEHLEMHDRDRKNGLEKDEALSLALTGDSFASSTITNIFMEMKGECVYQCWSCKSEFGCGEGLGNHIMKHHFGAEPPSIEQQRVKTVYVLCKLCQQPVPKDNMEVNTHRKTFHNEVNLRVYKAQCLDLDYENQDEEENTKGIFDQCKYKCDKCEHVTTSGRSMRCHLQAKHPSDAIFKPKSMRIRTVWVRCKLCGRSIPKDTYEVSRHKVTFKHGGMSQWEFKATCLELDSTTELSDDNSTLSRFEEEKMNVYSCRLCEYRTNANHNIYYHMRAAHLGTSHFDYDTLSRRYSCKLCGKGMVAEKRKISLHCTKQHKMTFTAYLNLYEPEYCKG